MFTIICTTADGLRNTLSALEGRKIDAKLFQSGSDQAVLIRVFD